MSELSATMAPAPSLPRRMLPVLQSLALACLAIAAVLGFPTDQEAGADGAWLVSLVWGVLAIVIAGAWMLRARLRTPRSRAVLSVVVVLLVTPVAVFGRIGFTVPVLLLAVALVVLDVSVRAGIAATVWIGALGIALHVASWGDLRTGLGIGLLNSVPVMVLLCFGIVLGWTLGAYELQLRRDAALIDRLRRAAETEKELLLADERARSARELHDGLGHRLTLVSISLDFAERMRERDAQAAWGEVAQAHTTSQEALEEMRTWVRALSPVRDPAARGASALDAIAESFRGTGLAVEVTVDDRSNTVLTTDDALSLLVYRAVQEGLTNALRHGRAREVQLGLRAADGQLRLRMSNDLGPGAQVPDGEAEPGFGLRGLAERALARGGGLRAAREGDRFLLALQLPVPDLSRASGSPRGAVGGVGRTATGVAR